MGFVRERIYKLVWDDGELAGLEMQARSGGVDLFAALVNCRDDVGLADLFAPLLISWNLTDLDARPVPCDRAGLGTVDADMLALIVAAWVNAVAGVSPPLPTPSAGGLPLAEASIPMDVSLASPSS